jgi:hypothetical protein
MIGCFILGFMIQWIVLYVPRRAGYFRDIDWIVLPKEMTQVDLYDKSISPPTESKRLKPPSAGTMLMLLLILLPMIGCKSREEQAWEQGYDANRSAAYHEGWRDGAARGKREGEEHGRAAAKDAAEMGHAWKPYSTPAFLALMFGVIVGLAAQYTILACCKDSGRLPELVTVAFVPATKHSLAYSILERRRQLRIWWDEEMRNLAAARKLRVTQIHAVHNLILSKIKAISSLEDFTQAHLIDLARAELTRIVSDSEQEASRIADGEGSPQKTSVKYTIACPHCKKMIGYKENKAGKSVNCPYEKCGRPINLPQLPSNGDKQPPIPVGGEGDRNWWLTCPLNTSRVKEK